MTDKNRRAFIEAFMDEVWSNGDCARIGRFIAPRYTIYADPGDPWDGRTLDRAGFVERLEISRAPFPDQRFTVNEVHLCDEIAAIAWGWEGTHLADLPGFPASNRRIITSGLTFYYFENELLRGHRQQTDHLSVYQQLAAPG